MSQFVDRDRVFKFFLEFVFYDITNSRFFSEKQPCTTVCSSQHAKYRNIVEYS